MPENVFCSKCGALNSNLAQFCQNCGGSMLAAPAASTPPPPQPAAYAPIAQPAAYAPTAQPVAYAPQPAGYAPAAVSPYGGFWIRLLAFFIDRIILGIVGAPIAVVVIFPTIGRIIQEAENNQEPSPEAIISMLAGISVWLIVFFIGYWLYEALLTSSSWQGTIGKRVLRLKVVDEAGNRISFARSTGRFFAKVVSYFIMYIGFIMVAFTDRKRGLHDMMAGTLVMKY